MLVLVVGNRWSGSVLGVVMELIRGLGVRVFVSLFGVSVLGAEGVFTGGILL